MAVAYWNSFRPLRRSHGVNPKNETEKFGRPYYVSTMKGAAKWQNEDLTKKNTPEFRKMALERMAECNHILDWTWRKSWACIHGYCIAGATSRWLKQPPEHE